MLRWGLKKLSRRAVAGASWVAGLSRSEQPISVRVLTYHHFGNSKYDPFSIPPAQFDAQMAFLAKGKLALSLTGLKGFLDGTIAVPHNSVLVTIDDGYLSTWSIALPILKTHGIPAVAFVTPDLVGRRISTDQHITRTYAGWAELSELSVSGIEVASHSLSHRSLGSMSANQVREEAAKSKAMLEDRLGIEVSAFAYPYGTLADFNTSTGRILREVGYRMAFTSQHGAVLRGGNPWELPRIKIEGGDATWMFSLATRGALDQWKWIDQRLWRIQASPRGRSPA